MKKLVLALSIVLLALLASSCDNSTPKDYNNLTAEQNVSYNEIGMDFTDSVSRISFASDSSTVATAPTGMTATRSGYYSGNSYIVELRINYRSYVGSINGYTISGTVVYRYNFDSIYSSYASSATGVINISASKNGYSHYWTANADIDMNNNTGAVKSSVETGTFDGAGYRESK